MIPTDYRFEVRPSGPLVPADTGELEGRWGWEDGGGGCDPYALDHDSITWRVRAEMRLAFAGALV